MIERPVDVFLRSDLGRRVKVSEAYNMLKGNVTSKFKGIDAKRYIIINWCEEGDKGKTTIAYLWGGRNRKTVYEFVVDENGYYGGVFTLGYDYQDIGVISEFRGNWRRGFWDFIDFLDAHKSKLVNIKNGQATMDFEFLCINSNDPPRDWLWVFPGEARRRLTDAEWVLFTRRLHSGSQVGGGIVKWDGRKTKYQSETQPFFWDLYKIREFELGAVDPLDYAVRVIPEMFIRNQILEDLPLPTIEVPDEPVDVLARIRELIAQEAAEEDAFALERAATVLTPPHSPLLSDEALARLDRRASKRQRMMASAGFDNEAEDPDDSSAGNDEDTYA